MTKVLETLRIRAEKLGLTIEPLCGTRTGWYSVESSGDPTDQARLVGVKICRSLAAVAQYLQSIEQIA